MLVYKNKEFRNLQEQVWKNMSDIATIKSSGLVLDEFGIKVVGQESSVANMPTVADYKLTNPDWAYGDAYAIGTEAPYTLYILTREDANHTDDYWFNIGRFPEPGPQGPKGDTGDTGPQGQTGNPGADGAAAGFGVVSASATTLTPGSDATVSVVASGPNIEKSFVFTFGIPKGEPGDAPELEWGNITGDISNQTDLVSSLQAKQNLLVSGTNIKTINNESILGSGNIVIQGGGGDVTDVEVNGVSVVDAQGVAEVVVPTKTSDLTNDSGFITSSALTGYATETWVGQQGYITGITSSDVVSALGYTPGTSNFSGAYADLTGKPDLSIYAETSDLATVAFSGSYNDLSNKPSIPTATSDLTNDSGFITGITSSDVTTALGYTPYNATNPAGYITSSALTGYATKSYVQGYHDSTKQDVISDLSTIRSGAALGATAVQPAALNAYITKADGDAQTPDEISGVKFFVNGISVGTFNILNSTGSFMLYNTAEDCGHEIYSNPTNNRFITLPDASGTLALTSDIPTVPVQDVTLGSVSVLSGTTAVLPAYPTVPTNVSSFTNDAGYITSSALSGYVDLTTAQSISGRKTFNSGISIGYSGNVCGHIEGDNTTELIIKSATTLVKPINAQVYLSSVASGSKPIVTVLGNIEPYNDNDNDLGRTNRRWKDLYLVGNLTDGTNSIAIADIASTTNSETWTFTLSDGTTITKTIVLG